MKNTSRIQNKKRPHSIDDLCGRYFQSSVSASTVLAKGGWGTFFNDTSHNENNYYQAAGRAVMLLGYFLTGQDVFLVRTKVSCARTCVCY